jgi:hypothetical protein
MDQTGRRRHHDVGRPTTAARHIPVQKRQRMGPDRLRAPSFPGPESVLCVHLLHPVERLIADLGPLRVVFGRMIPAVWLLPSVRRFVSLLVVMPRRLWWLRGG